MSYTWEYAIATVNDDRSILMRSRLISAPQEQIMPKDSYGASRKGKRRSWTFKFVPVASLPWSYSSPRPSHHAVCKLFRTSLSGLVALFGPQAPQNAGHIQSLSEALHIPHIETRWRIVPSTVLLYYRVKIIRNRNRNNFARWDYSLEKKEFSMNLHPHPSIVGKAFADLIREMNWKSFIIIYEDEESLIRLQVVVFFGGGNLIQTQNLLTSFPMTNARRR